MAELHEKPKFFQVLLLSLTSIVLLIFPLHAWVNGAMLAPMRASLHAHAFAYGAWFILVSLQASLIAKNNVSLHRKLGLLSLLLVPIIISTGILVGYENSVRRSSPDLLISSSIAVAIFALLYLIALLKRREPQWHKRMIVFASISIMLPAFARVGYVFSLPLFWGLLPWAGYVSSVLIYDKCTLGKISKASMLGLALSITQFLLLLTFVGGAE